MPITIGPNDVIAPDGELAETFFPDNDLYDMLGGWISQAILAVQANPNIAPVFHQDAMKAKVYSLAYGHIARRLFSMPNNQSLNAGAESVSIGADRPKYWQDLADAKDLAYRGYIVVKQVNNTPHQSTSIPTQFIY